MSDAYLDATAQAALVRNGDASPLELVDEAIGRIEKLNGELNAVIHERFEQAATFVPFTPVVNITGQPAISLPLHWNGDNLPIGVHLIAQYGREDVLLRVASQLEHAKPWAARIPPVHV
jgi:Asp-tRNA(Asn)/Glu-tRNA(Gln) amidotransferase A subunit family amidase